MRQLAQARVTSVSCGAFFTGACCDDGTLWMWGNGAFGQLGTGSKGSSVLPVRVESLHGQCCVTAVSCGTWHAAALGEEARAPGTSLWVWGDNAHGQLGTGGRRSVLEPERLQLGQRCGTATVVRVECFATHTACVACEGASLFQDGAVFTWGNNSSGQLGLGHTCSALEPTEVPALRAMLISSGPGASHTLAANREGLLFAWGSCGFGQLGSGQRENLLVPTPVLGLYENAKEEGKQFVVGSTNVRPHWWRSAALEDLEKIVRLRMARSRQASEAQEADKVQGTREACDYPEQHAREVDGLKVAVGICVESVCSILHPPPFLPSLLTTPSSPLHHLICPSTFVVTRRADLCGRKCGRGCWPMQASAALQFVKHLPSSHIEAAAAARDLRMNEAPAGHNDV